MDNFLARVEKEMLKLRKRNLNIVNEFKIEMYQTRKNIDRQLIEKQYGKITEENKSTLTTAPNKQMYSFMKKDAQSIIFINQQNRKQSYNTSKRGSSNNYSTNHHSQAQQTLQSHFHNDQFYNTIYENNKQNSDPNIRIKTDISVNQYESFGKQNDKDDSKIKINDDHFTSTNQDGFDLNTLKNDESMEINTSDVKKKYMKFVSPSAGWTISATSKKQNQEIKGIHAQEHPFCSSFAHEPEYFQTQQDEIVEQNDEISKDFDLFGFKGIDQGHFSKRSTIQELVEAEDFTQSIDQ